MDTRFLEKIEHTKQEAESPFILNLPWIAPGYPNTMTKTLKPSGLSCYLTRKDYSSVVYTDLLTFPYSLINSTEFWIKFG